MSYKAGSDCVHTVTDPVTGTVSYTYAVGGARLSMSLPGGNAFTYTYQAGAANNPGLLPKDDPNSMGDLLTRITDDQNRKVDYTMDMDGTPRSVKFDQAFDGGGNLTQYAQADYTYDLDTGNSKTHNWLKQIKQTWNRQTSPYPFPNGTWTQTTLVQYAYTQDAAGMRLTNAVSDNGGLIRTETYGYDELYRLTSVNYGDGQTQSYTFDAMGNRAQKQDSVSGTENYTYNAANMLLTRGASSYTNDSNGNTLTGGGRTSAWDSSNRLRQCVYGGVTTTHTYGMDGIRHRTVNGANTTDYVLDGPMFVRELLNGAVNATYLVGLRGPEYRRDSAGTVRWYLYDGLGSCSGEVDPNGNITASRKFDVYGSVRSTTGTSTTKHKFCGSLGHPSEDETGLIYMRARYMDPVTGRFISEDPGYQGANWFGYCGSNPVNRVDQNGRAWLTESAINYIKYALQYIGGLTNAEIDFLRQASVEKVFAFLMSKRSLMIAAAEADLEMAALAAGVGEASEGVDGGFGISAAAFKQAQNFLTRSIHNAFAAEGLYVIAWLLIGEGFGFRV